MKKLIYLFILMLPINVYSQQIRTQFNPGLAALYHINDCVEYYPGATVKDYISGTVGTLHGIPAWVTGKFSGALNFGGGRQVRNWVATSYSFSMTTSCTFMAWIYRTGNQAYHIILLDSGFNWIFALSNNQNRLCLYMGDRNPDWSQNANTTVPLNQWVFLCATWNGTTLQYYYNGQPDGNYNCPGTNTTPAATQWIGAFAESSGDTWCFCGIIDELAIWANWTMSPAEILYNYNLMTKGNSAKDQ